MPWDQIPERATTNFKFNLRTTSNDGISERLETDAEIVVTVDTTQWDGQRGDPQQPKAAAQHGLMISYPGQHVQYPDEVILPEGLFLTVYPIPTPNTTMLAVDPRAERQLLGAAGEFLDPLEKAAEELKLRGGLTAAGYQLLLDSGAGLLGGLLGGLLLQTALQVVAAAALIGMLLWLLRVWFIATPAGLLAAFGALALWGFAQDARLYRLRPRALSR